MESFFAIKSWTSLVVHNAQGVNGTARAQKMMFQSPTSGERSFWKAAPGM